MTLPASGTISLTMVMDELRGPNPSRAYPINLGDSDVRALAGKPSGPISLSDLYGKSAAAPSLVVTGTSDSQSYDSRTSGGNASALPEVSVSGGSAPYMVNWTVVDNPNGCQFIGLQRSILPGSTSTTCTVYKGYVQNSTGYARAVLNVTVTDVNGLSGSANNVVGELQWSGTV